MAKHAFGSRQYDNALQGDNLTNTGTQPLVPWLRQFRGIKAVLDAGWQWIPQLKHLRPMLHILIASTLKSEELEKTVFTDLLDGLDESHADSPSKEAYKVAVDHLSSVLLDPNFRGLVGFGLAVPDKFIELVENRDPRAMAIMCSYLAFFGLGPPNNLTAVARQEYNAIMRQLPSEWDSKMKWAIAVFGNARPE